MNRTIEIQHNGTTYYGKVARVESTMLGVEDHGIVTAYLRCKGDGWGIGVGGYCLDMPVKVDGKHSHREGTGYGLDHIMRLAQTVGSPTWEGCKDKDVVVLFTTEHSWGSTAVGIAHVSDESKVLILKEHAEAWETTHPAETDGGEKA